MVIVLATVMVLDDVMILSRVLLSLLLLIGLIVLAHVMVLTYVMALIPEMGGNHYNNTTEMVLTMLCYVNLCYDLILRNGINPCFCVSLCYGVTCVTALTHVMVLAPFLLLAVVFLV